MLVPVRGLVLILFGGLAVAACASDGGALETLYRWQAIPSLYRDRLPNQLPLYGPQPVKTRKFGRIIRTQ